MRKGSSDVHVCPLSSPEKEKGMEASGGKVTELGAARRWVGVKPACLTSRADKD